MMDDDSLMELVSNDPGHNLDNDIDDIPDTPHPKPDNVSIEQTKTSTENVWDFYGSTQPGATVWNKHGTSMYTQHASP